MSNRRISISLFFNLFAIATIALLPQAMFGAAAKTTTSAAVTVPDRITQGIDESNLATLSRNTRPEANAANDRGRVADTMAIDHIFLLLQRSPQQEQALDTLIEQLNDRTSPNFHKWLTAAAFGQKYGVSQGDIDTVTKWLESHGFRVNQVYPNHIVIDISGTAGQVREAFHTEIHQLSVNGESHISNMSDPRIPTALAPVISGIFSLNDFKPHPMYRSATQYTFAGCASSTDAPTEPGTCYGMTPQDNQTIYNLNPVYAAGYSGQGQTIALVEDTDTYGGANDWNSYRSTFGLSTAFPLGTYTQVHPGCSDPGTNADDGEAAIDVEMASAIAPSAAIENIACASGTVTFGGLIAMQNLFNGSGPYPGVVSVSYGVCEAFNGNGGNQAFYNTYQQGAAEGISIFGASGDEGPSSCSADFSVGSEYDVSSLGVSGWTDTPFNVAVGGTDFEDTYNSKEGGNPLSTYWSSTNTSGYGSALSYVPEMPWDDACANALISEVAHSSFTTYGTAGTCNTSPFNTTSGYLIAGAGSGGASNCATGSGGTDQGDYGISDPQCQGYAKPSWQSAYGVPNDGVRDIPDISMFAANGVWGHYELVCWSDPSYTSDGAASCSGAPSTWSGFGGTSVASPTLAGIQALVNQKTGEMWGNPNPIYYQIAQGEYGTQGGTFAGSSCNSSGSGGPAAGCAFNDVTQGDIDLACEDNGSTEEAHCYKPSGTYGVDSTDNVTAATILNGGSGYTSAPTCTIAGPTNNQPYLSPTGSTLFAGGTQAACTATVSTSTTTAKWTVAMESVDGVGDTIILTTPPGVTPIVTCGPYTLSGSSTTTMASGLVTSIGTGCSLATATSSTKTVTLTAKTAGYAGDFITEFGTATEFDAFYVYITNTTLGQGPNYVSGITITTAGSGYQPETPITLTGGGGSGAVAVANTSVGTASSTYQPAYGAAPGYDMATGLGSVNAYNLVNASAWLPAEPPGIYSPTPGSTFTGGSATFAWGAEPSATGYWLDVGAEQGSHEYYSSGTLSSSTFSQAVSSLPTDGSTVYVTWYYLLSGTWTATNYTYTAFGGNSGAAVITNPAPSSTLTGSSVTFSWSAATDTPQAYWLDIGSTAGAHDIYSSGSVPTSTSSLTVNGIPTNGSTIYATMYTETGGVWVSNAYTYTEYSLAAAAGVMTTPTPGSTLTSSSVTFDWSAGSGASGYWIDIGSTSGAHDIYSSGNLGVVLTDTVSGLPTDGSTIYVTLYTLIGGTWTGNAYSYTTFNATSGIAVMQTPTPGSTLSGTSVTFTWSSDPSATGYWVDVSAIGPGGNDLDSSGNLGTALTETIYNLPADGSEIYVTLYSYVGGQWLSSPATYTSGPHAK